MHDDRGANFAQIERDHVRSRLYDQFDWHPFDDFSPYNPLPVPLAAARVGFVSTAGVHLPAQSPFNIAAPEGDASWRAIPGETPLAELTLSHGGYDTRRAAADINVVFPLDHLRDFVAEGHIGSLATNAYAFMGYVADSGRLLRHEAPAVAERLLTDRVDLVLLAPT